MQSGFLFTTPFGRRAVSLGMLAAQVSARDIVQDAAIDKWKVFRDLSAARPVLGLSDRTLLVLNALLSFYPQVELSAANGLVVFPSNAQLSLRAHGMAPATLRRHLSALVEAGLIVRKDSANGKRFSRKARYDDTDGAGEPSADGREAFGFNISPLIARAAEFATLAEDVRAAHYRLKTLKEKVTIIRRDVVKLIALGIETLPHVDWQAKQALLRSTLDDLPRLPSEEDLVLALDGLECLHIEISNLFEMSIKSKNMSANESHSERHIQNSNTNFSSDLEPALKKSRGRTGEDNLVPLETKSTNAAVNSAEPHQKSAESGHDSRKVPLSLVMRACPDIADYGRGEILTWRDLMAAAIVVRSMLGVSASAYEDAAAAFGQEQAAVIIALILQRAGHINSAGGYLRNLTQKAKAGEFSIWPMLLAQLRANGGHLALV
jgi:replication initiation protein RepC